MNESPALQLLLREALSSGVSLAGQRIAFIHAFAHPLLTELKESVEHLCLVQSFKPEINHLSDLKLEVSSLQGQFDLVLMIPSKDKVQSLGWMSLAFEHLSDGGKFLVACENQYGAKSYESALKKLAGTVGSSSKAKCRSFSAKKTSALNLELMETWAEGALPKHLESHGLWVQAGLFSWKSADIGSLLLLKHVPVFQGVGMDLCCGYGLLSQAVLESSPDIKHLHMVEAEALALGCAKKNVEGFGKVEFHHLDAAEEALPKHLDWIVCNPPFHTGQTRDVELGQTIISRACEALKYAGELYMVANRQLPYEKVLQQHLREVETLAVGQGFKVIRGIK